VALDAAPRGSGDGIVGVRAWGPGADLAVAAAPALLGVHDDPRRFTTDHPVVRPLHRRRPGWRFGRTPSLGAAAVATICGQRVTTTQQVRSWRALVLALGEPSPGPPGLSLPPQPERLAELTDFDAHRFGIERRRAATVRAVSRLGDRLEVDRADGLRRLGALPGVGPWTITTLHQIALGDPDAVILGDLHLPRLVVDALEGTRPADDRQMLDLLAPFAGHRGRVGRIVLFGGGHTPPRAPRRRIVDMRTR
jgi:3-methyladenine DNA glycosylase/8-oxoguanine DNA glycosylase